MLHNYLKIAFRNLLRNKLNTGINIVSLAIGLSASFVIGLMVYYDLTFDTYHPESDRIYRITSLFTSPQGEFGNSGVPIPLVRAAREEMTGLETVAGFNTIDLIAAKNPLSGQDFKDLSPQVFADASYFGLFSYHWLAGSPQGLEEPYRVVLTDRRAARYFPGQDPADIMGKTLVYNDSVPVTVTGVVAAPRQRTDLVFEEFLSPGTLQKTERGSYMKEARWDNTSSSDQLFVRLSPGTDPAGIQQQLDRIARGQESDFDRQFGQTRTFELQPFSELHFNTNLQTFDNGRDSAASRPVLVGLGFIALFLLLLGCINFINLSTAQADQRAREIGIRKTLGSSKKQLLLQFLGETFLLTLMAALLSLVLAYFLLDTFGEFLPEGLHFGTFAEGPIVLFAGMLLVLVTLLAGVYPALVLTRFQPVRVLKNQVVNSAGKPTLRRILTVFQFAIAQIFIMATLLVGKQIRFMLNKDLGFQSEAIVQLYVPWHLQNLGKTEVLAQEIGRVAQVEQVALGGHPPASNSTNTSMSTVYRDSTEIRLPLQILAASPAYFDLYHLEFLAGRKPLNDTILEYVINETYLHALGFDHPGEAIGQLIHMNQEDRPIVGVVRDFSQRSAKEALNPLALVPDWDRSPEYSRFNSLHLKLQGGTGASLTEALSAVEAKWKQVFPEADFEPRFVDETVAGFYNQERSLAKLLRWAMGLSILISCLGLLGLVIYTTNRRTKEIGIRKVLGASLSQIGLLLSRDFLALVGIAFLIAAPLAGWGLYHWLQDYAYRTELSWWIFALSGAGMIALALLIMGLRTLVVARRNPVKSLRTE